MVDETGKVVQDVHLMITNTEDDENDYETTDERGYFKFVDIEPGNYLIRIYGINGLRKAMPPVTVNAGQTLNQYLHVTREKDTDSEETTYFGSGMGGAMAVIPYKLPLTQAVAEGDLDKVRTLIASGSDVNEGDENYDGITALFIAVENGNLDMIRLLLEHHADVNAKNTAEMTPLMFLDEDASTQVLQMLLNAGADANAAAKDGSSILSNIINSASEDVVEMAIRAGAPVDKPNQAGETPLMKVAERGKPELVRILLEAGADARASDGSGQTAWDRATNAKIEEMLVAYGASADYGNIVVANRSTKDDDH